MELIVDKFITELNEQLAARKVTLAITADVRTWLAKKGYDPTYGARPLSRLMQSEIKDRLSDEILMDRKLKLLFTWVKTGYLTQNEYIEIVKPMMDSSGL